MENWCSDNNLEIPDEETWERSARAGSKGEYFFDDPGELREYAWTGADIPLEVARPGPTDVAGRRCNGFGLFDVLGNVAEVCVTNRVVHAADPQYCIRGGFFLSSLAGARSSMRDPVRTEELASVGMGLRPVRRLNLPAQ
jgi:formylglycine-generating enzyme required for sulfatase activity